MKNLEKYFSPILLLAYCSYSAFISINIAHSVILFSLAGLYGFQLYLKQRHEHTSKINEFAQAKEKLEQELKQQKEYSDAKFAKFEEELSKVALTISRVPSSKTVKQSGEFIF